MVEFMNELFGGEMNEMAKHLKVSIVIKMRSLTWHVDGRRNKEVLHK
jgi:hypothetical protein